VTFRLSIAFLFLTLEASIGSAAVTGALSHIADGGSWKTIITVVNLSDQPRNASLLFWDSSGSPMMLTIVGIGTTARIDLSLAANGAATVETAGIHNAATQVGWALVLSDFPSDIGAIAVFRNHISDGLADQEAAVPLQRRSESHFLLPFDHTNGFATGVAFANPAQSTESVITGSASLALTFRDESGNILLSTAMNLAPGNLVAFSLTDRYPELANKRGTLEVVLTNAVTLTDGSVSALGLRFTPLGSFTSVNPIVKRPLFATNF
jgi:hypothetical protein